MYRKIREQIGYRPRETAFPNLTPQYDHKILGLAHRAVQVWIARRAVQGAHRCGARRTSTLGAILPSRGPRHQRRDRAPRRCEAAGAALGGVGSCVRGWAQVLSEDAQYRADQEYIRAVSCAVREASTLTGGAVRDR